MLPLEVRQEAPGGLLQVLHVSDTVPQRGDTLYFQSTVYNVADSTVTLHAKLACLDITGDLSMVDPVHFRVSECGSEIRPLIAGDSLIEGALRVVLSPPGSYTIWVRHLLEPDVSIEVPVRVKD